MKSKRVFKENLIYIVLIALIIGIFAYQYQSEPIQDCEISSGWTITSYEDVNEALYSGQKIEVFDRYGNSLGFYKTDFLEQVKIDGSGKGDGVQNPGKYLHYDYEIDDGITYYLSDISLGAYGNEVIPWTEDKPTIAINPPMPLGTKIKFVDLGPDAENNPDWVNEILKTKTFYVGDTFYGVGDEKKIDIYVGLQKKLGYDKPEALYMTDVTIAICK